MTVLEERAGGVGAGGNATPTAQSQAIVVRKNTCGGSPVVDDQSRLVAAAEVGAAVHTNGGD
ncbi:hypothetical protein K7G98_00580 [Saccharothrix sp. MB29]|nr:hypothetical protein [Saccharothrix sp. MB29]